MKQQGYSSGRQVRDDSLSKQLLSDSAPTPVSMVPTTGQPICYATCFPPLDAKASRDTPLLQSDRVFSHEGSPCAVRLLLAEVHIALTKAKAQTGKDIRIPLWNLLNACMFQKEKTVVLELTVYGLPSVVPNSRGGGGCCGSSNGGATSAAHLRTRATVQLVAAAEDGPVVRSWCTILRHACLSSLPGPPSPSSSASTGGGDSRHKGGYAPWLAQAGSDTHASLSSPLPAPPRDRKLLVYINPAAGSGKALEFFDEEARPVLEDGGCSLDVRTSERGGHVTEEVRSMPWDTLQQYCGIVAVGGDGSLSEVVNGILGRPDWRTVVEAVPLGILPGGSGNGLSHSFQHAAGLPSTMAHAAHLIAKGRVTRMDVASTCIANEAMHEGEKPPVTHAHSTAGSYRESATHLSPLAAAEGAMTPVVAHAGEWGHRRWQFLSAEWAIVSDIDLESESLRFLGAARFDVYGAARAFNLRKYRGRFCYLPAEKGLRSGRRWAQGREEGGDPTSGAATPASAPHLLSPSDALPALLSEAAEESTPGFQLSKDGAGVQPLPDLHHLPPFDVPVPLSWRTLEGTFTFLWITNTSHQSAGVACSAPGSHHADGTMCVTLIRDCSSVTMIRMLLNLDGSSPLPPGVERFHCLAWRLEPEHRGDPLPPTQHRSCDPKVRYGHGHVAVDGEAVPYGPVQAELHPGLLRVFGPAPTGGNGV